MVTNFLQAPLLLGSPSVLSLTIWEEADSMMKSTEKKAKLRVEEIRDKVTLIQQGLDFRYISPLHFKARVRKIYISNIGKFCLAHLA